MPRRGLTAAEYIESVDPEMRVILGELNENAARASLHWANAASLARADPARAMKELAEAWAVLSTTIRIERADSPRRINHASDLLDRELRDGGVDGG
jgi:hypothetical protein